MTTTDQAPEAPPERPQPANVIEALARVAEELPGIGRTEHSEQGYNYRGIEGITRHAQQLFGRYGVVFVPKVLDRQVKDFTINSKPWTEDAITVVYTVYGPGGAADSIEVGPLVGLGRDNSDKGANKAMTQAFKYALIQTLCIGDGKDDPDREKAHEADARTEPVDPDLQVRRDLQARVAAYPPVVREKVRAFVDEHGIPRVMKQLDDEQVETLTAHLDGLDQALSDEAEPDSAPEDGPDAPSLPLDGVETPSDGPESAPEAQDAQPPADPPTAAQGDTVPQADHYEAAIAHLAAIDKRQVVLELGSHGLATTGNEQAMRKRLALFYAEHPDQLPT